MITQADAWELLTLIKHTDGRIVSEDDAKLWAITINHALPDCVIVACKNAYAQWQSMPHKSAYVQPQEIIAIIRKHRPSASLTEAEIGRMLEPLDLSDDEMWAARRALIGNLNRGMSQHAALSSALDAAHGRLLPSAPEKPKPTHNHHFAGNLSLGDVIGHE